jgi:carboxyl-terminal processing protease
MKLRALAAALAGAALMTACGGGDDDGGHAGTPLSCSVADRQDWLRGYMADWYFWYKVSPSPDPSGYATVEEYFDALLYPGSTVPGADFPEFDRWSYYQSTESFDRFYGDGQTLGYGVFVAGDEVVGAPNEPLLVRYVEPQSPAAAAGIVRGDQIVSINGRTSADIIGSDDFGVLTPAQVGDVVSMVLRTVQGADRTVTLTAAVFNLTPVPTSTVVTSNGGRKLGYVVVKDMISQSHAPLDAAFQNFKAQGVQDVVLDLRYNGGGLVSTAGRVASQVAAGAAGQPFATLLYNDRQASNNQTFPFVSLASALPMSRVYVLTGHRTCSASEQVINGLRGVGLQVVAIGDTTCGKPVGFLPEDDGCGTTFSVVNFESVNARNEGRYFAGFAPTESADGTDTCRVPDDFTTPLGAPNEPLLEAARLHADTGTCGWTTVARERPMALKPLPGRRTISSEPRETGRMWGR